MREGLRRAIGRESEIQGKGITEARGMDVSTESDPTFTGRSKAMVRAVSVGQDQYTAKQGVRGRSGWEDSPGMVRGKDT